MDWKGENDGWILSKYIVCIRKILNKKKDNWKGEERQEGEQRKKQSSVKIN